MNQKKKLIGVLLFIVCGYLLFGMFSFVIRTFLGYEYPDGSFLFWPGDRFMDFFNVNKMVSEGKPYIEHYSSYPPFILGIAWIFSLFADYTQFSAKEISMMPVGMISYAVFVVVFTALIAVVLYKFLSKREDIFPKKWMLIPAIVCIIFTAPYIFMLDRGNYLLVAIACYLAFVYYYEENEVAAAVFLGLAAAIKIYPIFLILIYILEKKWKNIAITIGSAGIVSMIPFMLFRGGMIRNAIEFVYALASFGGGYGNEVPNVYFGVGLTSLLRFPFVVWNDLTVPEWFPVMPIYLVVGSVLALWSLFMLRNEQMLWKKILVLTTLMIFLSPNAYMYNLTFLMPVLVVFILADKSAKTWKDWVYLGFLGLLVIPKAYYYMMSGHGIGIQVALDGLLLPGLVLFYNIFDSETRSIKKVK